MFQVLGFSLLFFLPVVESFNRSIGLALLLSGSLFLSWPLFLKRRIHFDLVDTLFIILLIIFSISTIFSWSISRSYLELTRYLAYFLIFIAIRSIEIPSQVIKLFYIPMVLINSLILSLLSFIYFFPLVDLGLPKLGMSLFYFSQGHNHVTDILIFTIPLTIFLATVKAGKNRKLFLLLAIFFMAAFVLALSRGALFVLTLSYILYSFVFKRRSKYYSSWINSLIVISFVFILSSLSYSYLIASIEKEARSRPKFYKPLSNEWRVDYIGQAISGLKLSPILGTGLDTFRFISKKYQGEPNSWSWYTHNHFLQLLTETGIIGGLLFALFVLVILVKSYERLVKKRNLLYDSIFISALSSFTHSLIDFDWQFLSIFLIFFMTVALLLPVKSSLRVKRISPATYLYKLMLLIFSLLFIFAASTPLDSNKAISKAEIYLSIGQKKKAISLLNRAYRLDSNYNEISTRFGWVYSTDFNTWDKSHYYNQQAILQGPLDSVEVIKRDYLLYFQQAKYKIFEGNLEEAEKLISSSNYFYTPYQLTIEEKKYVDSMLKFLEKRQTKEALILLNLYIKKVEEKQESIYLEKNDIDLIVQRLADNECQPINC